MIDQMIIINSAGLPLFNWEPEDKQAEGSMISGFLTAMDTFAKGEKGESIRKITLDPTTFIFERAEELIFVILTSDPDHEQLIRLILEEVKATFLENFLEAAKTFSGNLSTFKPFNGMLEQILKKYGYFDYVRVKNIFDTDEMLKAILFLKKDTGEILYIKAKEYLDRNALSFQTIILLNSIDRVISKGLNEKPMISVLISQKSRCLLVKSTEKIVIIQEKIHRSTLNIAEVKINEKRITNILKKPEKLIFESKENFLFFDPMGKNIVSNDRVGQFEGDSLPPDCITLVNTSKNIIEQIYRETFFSILVFTESKLYSAFPITDYYTFMEISIADSTDFKTFYEKLNKCEVVKSEDVLGLNQIIESVNNFRAFFS